MPPVEATSANDTSGLSADRHCGREQCEQEQRSDQQSHGRRSVAGGQSGGVPRWARGVDGGPSRRDRRRRHAASIPDVRGGERRVGHGRCADRHTRCRWTRRVPARTWRRDVRTTDGGQSSRGRPDRRRRRRRGRRRACPHREPGGSHRATADRDTRGHRDGRLRRKRRRRRCACRRGGRRGSRLRRGCGRRRRGRLNHDRRRRRRRGSRSRSRRRRRLAARRQVCQRVEVALRVGGRPEAEVHVSAGDLGGAARTGEADHVPLGEGRAFGCAERAEVRERDREPVGRRDRDRLAGAGDRAGERHRAGGGRTHGLARLGADVDPAVLARRVRVRRIEDERLQDVAAGRPRPGAGAGGQEGRGHGRDKKDSLHRHHLCCPSGERCFEGRCATRCCQTRLQSCHRVRR